MKVLYVITFLFKPCKSVRCSGWEKLKTHVGVICYWHNICSFIKVLGAYGKKMWTHVGFMCYLYIFNIFGKVLYVIVKIIEASMCYLDVIAVYYNDNDGEKDNDVVTSNPESTSDPSPQPSPPTPIDQNSLPDQTPPTIPPPRKIVIL